MEQDQKTNKEKGSNEPMQRKDDVPTSNDKRINMDFRGYADTDSGEDLVTPKNNTDEKSAAANMNENAEEDSTYPEPKNRSGKVTEKDNEIESDGSGVAFGGTEEVSE